MKRALTATQVLLVLALLAIATLPFTAPVAAPESARADAELLAEEGEEEGENEEAEEEEFEEEGEEEEFEAKTTGPLPPECLLHTAEPNVVAQLGRASLHLTLHYTARAPTRLGIDYWLKGGKGSLQLGSVSRHIGSQGTLHLTRHLDEGEVAKVRAARVFIVDLDVPAAPSSCDKYLTLRLSAKSLHRLRATWSERPLN